jgi:hypothetical protein
MALTDLPNGDPYLNFRTRINLLSKGRIPDLRDYGALGHTNNDYTTEINNAVADAKLNSGILHIPKGSWWTNGITDGSQVLFEGDGPGTTRVKHIDGNATSLISILDGSALSAYPYYGFRDITFQSGSTTTAILWFNHNIDNNCTFHNLGLSGMDSDVTCHAIDSKEWLNFNARQLRFDGVTGYAFRFRDAVDYGQGHFHVDDWTYDNGTGFPSGRGLGIMLVDVSSANVKKGTIKFSNARIEINSKLTSVKPANGLFRIVQNSTAITSGLQCQAMFNLDNIAIDVNAAAKDVKIFSSNIGHVAVEQQNTTIYGAAEWINNDLLTGRYEVHMNLQGPQRIRGFNLEYLAESPNRGEGFLMRGVLHSTFNSETNFTGVGGVVKRADILYHTFPNAGSGRFQFIRPYAFKAVQVNDGLHHIALRTSARTASATASSANITLSGAPEVWLTPGVALDIAGAGASSGVLRAYIKAIDYDTNVLTMSANAGTTVAGAAVTTSLAQFMHVEMQTYAPGIPTTGTWVLGDVCKNTSFVAATMPVTEYVCTQGGTPGLWRASKWIVNRNTSPNRPSLLTANDVGVTFLDNTLAANGQLIVWNGTAWVKASDGTVA